MTTYEYDIGQFNLVERWSAKKKQESMQALPADLNAKGAQGWDLIGLHAFDLVGGVTGSNKGTTTLTIWKRETAVA